MDCLGPHEAFSTASESFLWGKWVPGASKRERLGLPIFADKLLASFHPAFFGCQVSLGPTEPSSIVFAKFCHSALVWLKQGPVSNTCESPFHVAPCSCPGCVRARLSAHHSRHPQGWNKGSNSNRWFGCTEGRVRCAQLVIQGSRSHDCWGGVRTLL